MEQNFIQEQKYICAKKQVEELKRYYWHLAIYLLVNTFTIIRKIVWNIDNGESFLEAFFDWSNFSLAILWGVGLMFHTLKMFGFNIFLGKDWEERKIKEFMNDEKM